ncbi:MAG: isoprenylcysteine carboxylmethyltransferase family protein [Pseudomonadota bacterium]
MLKWIDLPPVWLAAFAAAAWIIAPFDAGPLAKTFGAALVTTGLVLILWAAMTMFRARTTVVPHLRATSLVTTGPFRFSRNPIYLADALILAGLLLRWGLPWALPSVILLIWIINRRFILGEEARLKEDFGAKFDAWCAKTRRWI